MQLKQTIHCGRGETINMEPLEMARPKESMYL